jgi:3-keto-disaccharide hydrolase
MKLFSAILLGCAIAAAADPEPGFVSLFDGKTLNGWQLFEKGKGTGYAVENGLLVCPVTGGGNLFTTKEYADFVFRFEFKFEPGGNNGVGIRSPLVGDAAYNGMEIQILDHDHAKYKGRLKATQYHGSIYDVFPAKTGHLKPAGEWNQEEITAKGRRITVKLNGAVIVDADLDSVTDEAVLKKHPGLARKSGHIGFLGHGSLVEFRNIRVKEL